VTSLSLALGVAALLGLRHATDPDHLTAVSTLVLSEDQRDSRRAGLLGLAWGLGHAATLIALGLPIVLLGAQPPEDVQRAAELVIGVVIAVLAIRLLVRWRRGYLHSHVHSHGSVRHSHPHVHEHAGAHSHSIHEHAHLASVERSPLTAFCIGLLHGVGGSAAAGVLVVATASAGAGAALALTAFALATAVSMAACSAAFGVMLTRAPVARRIEALTPAAAVLALAFGAWYALGAVQAVPAVY
jgi:high-affinity nickel permease